MATTSFENKINKAKEIHHNKYDYTLVPRNLHTIHNVRIICPNHGEFKQTWKNHVKGRGCPKCANEVRNAHKKITVEKFLEKARAMHGDKYDYSEITSIKNNTQILPIICPVHGYTNQSAKYHFKHGCDKCSRKEYGQTMAKSEEIALEEMKKKYEADGNHHYDLSKAVYISAHDDLTVICKYHGKFITSHNKCMRGRGCQKCGKAASILARTKTTKNFIKEAIRIHGRKYDYSKAKYRTTKHPIDIICREHGVFQQSPECHLRGQGCPKHRESKGEMRIAKALTERGIKFEKDKKIPGMEYKGPLRLDFYWEDASGKCAIEYDGRQHFEPEEFLGGEASFKEIVRRDRSKDIYCLKGKKIRLLRIAYWEYKKIENIIDHYLMMRELPRTFKDFCVYQELFDNKHSIYTDFDE